LEVLVYMELLLGFDASDNESWKFYVLPLNKSLYGLKQGCTIGLPNWVMAFKIVILSKAVLIPEYSFGKGCIVSMYVDNCIIVAYSMNWIEE
jgi:hypothetical protein